MLEDDNEVDDDTAKGSLEELLEETYSEELGSEVSEFGSGFSGGGITTLTEVLEDVCDDVFWGTETLTVCSELEKTVEPTADEKFSADVPLLSTTITVACSVLPAQPPSIHETKANDSAAIVLLFIAYSPNYSVLFISVFILLYNYIYYNTLIIPRQ